MTAAPLSDARLSLKQVNVSALGEIERSVFAATLRTYGLDYYSKDDVDQGMASLSNLLAGAEVQFDSSGGRRFAGDRTLPRTRYFTVLEGGSDGRTLLREMSAYLTGSTYPGLVSLFDTDGANTLELLGILSDIPKRNYQALNLALPSLLIAVRPLNADSVLADMYGKGNQYVAQIPYRVSDRAIAGVLDLRKPEARTWLVAKFNGTFRIGEEDFPVLPGRRPLVDFEELLPSLLDQWLGGGWTTGNITGFFAREAGAGGLVYPSARSNACVEIRDDVVMDSFGWCFVSYKGAPKMETNVQFSIASDEWPARVGWSPQSVGWVRELIPLNCVEIEHVRSGSRTGSFAVHGLAEYNSASYRLSQVTTVLKCLDSKLGDDVSGRLSYLALYSRAEEISWLSGVLYGALLGDPRSLVDLKAAATNAGSDFERETLAGAQRLVALVPPAFHATKSLAKALGFS